MKTAFYTIFLVALISIGNPAKIYSQNNPVKNQTQQSLSVDGFIEGANGQWIKGAITYKKVEQKLIPERYGFRNIGGREVKGTFYTGTNFTKLNPNNKYAKDFNFTHFITLPVGYTVYVTLD